MQHKTSLRTKSVEIKDHCDVAARRITIFILQQTQNLNCYANNHKHELLCVSKKQKCDCVYKLRSIINISVT